MGNTTTEFLDLVQDTASLQDRQQTVEGVRALFRALMEGQPDADAREIAALLPEDLETLWKPAFYRQLRGNGPGAGPGGTSFPEQVRRHAPDLSDEQVDRLCRAVGAGLHQHLDAEQRTALEAYLPAALRRG